jgi:hypothetical protein
MSSVRYVGLNNKDYSPQQNAVEMKDLFGEILTVLKKIEFHLSIASDNELKDEDV